MEKEVTARSIKLRAWDKALGKWVYLHIDNSRNGAVYFTGVEANIVVGGAIGRRIGDWLQYTGLKDKNGVEIFEGDIVQQNKKKSDPFMGRKGDIRWNANMGCYGIYQGDNFSCVLYAYEQIVKDCKIIGNIYENPDLLGGEAAA